MVRTIIIDDETECIEDLRYLVEKHNLRLDIVATATSGNAALAAILKHKPDLVFLDVVMPGMSGFELLDLLPQIDFNLVITTSVDKYAIQAIRASAIDFLLKPVQLHELKQAINKVVEKTQSTSRTQVSLLAESMKEPSKAVRRIALVIKEGVQLVDTAQIIFFKADGNYTTVHLVGNQEILVSKPIGMFDDMVGSSGFYRAHNSYLVNLDHVSKFIRGEGGYLVMDDGTSVPVSRNKKEELLNVLSKI